MLLAMPLQLVQAKYISSCDSFDLFKSLGEVSNKITSVFDTNTKTTGNKIDYSVKRIKKKTNILIIREFMHA